MGRAQARLASAAARAQATAGGQILDHGKAVATGMSLPGEGGEVGRRGSVHWGTRAGHWPYPGVWRYAEHHISCPAASWLPWACPALSHPFLRLPQALGCPQPASRISVPAPPRPSPTPSVHRLWEERRVAPVTPRWVGHPQPSAVTFCRTCDSREVPEASMQPTGPSVSLEALPVPGAQVSATVPAAPGPWHMRIQSPSALHCSLALPPWGSHHDSLRPDWTPPSPGTADSCSS